MVFQTKLPGIKMNYKRKAATNSVYVAIAGVVENQR